MPKINQEEYGVLKGLDDKWKWIARNYNGALIIYTSKPMQNPNLYWDGFGERMDDRLFQFIQWEDEEPYNIAELIENFEEAIRINEIFEKSTKIGLKESEETEVKKDIEWLKEEVIKISENWTEDIRGDFARGLDRAVGYTIELINQLDEPEVLSQEWIKDHELLSTEKDADGNVHADRYIHVKDLENLLVPKQEEVDQAYKGGYETGKQHTFYKGYLEGLTDKEKEPETVASAIDDFFKSAKRMKEVLDMEVEELEE